MKLALLYPWRMLFCPLRRTSALSKVVLELMTTPYRQSFFPRLEYQNCSIWRFLIHTMRQLLASFQTVTIAIYQGWFSTSRFTTVIDFLVSGFLEDPTTLFETAPHPTTNSGCICNWYSRGSLDSHPDRILRFHCDPLGDWPSGLGHLAGIDDICLSSLR